MTNSGFLVIDRLTNAAIRAVLDTQIGDELYNLEDHQMDIFDDKVRTAVSAELKNERSKWVDVQITPNEQSIPDNENGITYRIIRMETVKAIADNPDGTKKMYDVGTRTISRDITSPLRVTVMPMDTPDDILKGLTPIDRLVI